MTHRLVCPSFAAVALLLVSGAAAQTPAHYRDFTLGSTIDSISRRTGVHASAAKTLHERPAVMRELELRPRMQSGAASTDPVDVMRFRFYNDRLYLIIIDYDRRRTEGMAPADLIEAISGEYGAAHLSPATQGTSGVTDAAAAGTPLARWGDDEYSVTLVRVTYPETYRVLVALTAVEGLARAANTEAVRLDAEEAPQRELARQKRASDEAQAAREKTKADNKEKFTP